MTIVECMEKWKELDWRGDSIRAIWPILSEQDKWAYYYYIEGIYICSNAPIDEFMETCWK